MNRSQNEETQKIKASILNHNTLQFLINHNLSVISDITDITILLSK